MLSTSMKEMIKDNIITSPRAVGGLNAGGMPGYAQ
jgi:hypothetical protein